MDVIELESGEWGIRTKVRSGVYVIKRGFRSNAAAWAWIDKNSQEGLDATDRFNRIRDCFNGAYYNE